MIKSTLLLAALATASLASIVKIQNFCSFPLYVTSVSSTVGNTTVIAASGIWSEPQRKDDKTGIAIKIAVAKEALYTSQPIITLAYTLNDNVPNIYYDLSTTYGYPAALQDKKISVTGDEGKDVPQIVWEGAPPGAQQTKSFTGSTDLVAKFCA